MTKLISAHNLNDLQQKLDQLMNDDEEDRPWFLHGIWYRDKDDTGLFYQMLTDENPRLITIALDAGSTIHLIKKLSSLPETMPSTAQAAQAAQNRSRR